MKNKYYRDRGLLWTTDLKRFFAKSSLSYMESSWKTIANDLRTYVLWNTDRSVTI